MVITYKKSQIGVRSVKPKPGKIATSSKLPATFSGLLTLHKITTISILFQNYLFPQTSNGNDAPYHL
jgi:hypothetical protein